MVVSKEEDTNSSGQGLAFLVEAGTLQTVKQDSKPDTCLTFVGKGTPRFHYYRCCRPAGDSDRQLPQDLVWRFQNLDHRRNHFLALRHLRHPVARALAPPQCQRRRPLLLAVPPHRPCSQAQVPHFSANLRQERGLLHHLLHRLRSLRGRVRFRVVVAQEGYYI